MTGKVVLAGAGCGDYDLITLRAVEALRVCDAVIYDSLIDTRILEFCPKRAERICVGKRAGKHSHSQEEINSLLIEKALEGKHIVRLKGGDPFVFGRGGEEISALRERGISYAVIPGVSSCIAVPELAGIPVTHRKTARSFHVITGHTAGDLSADNFRKYSALDGTLVFLMGLSNLGKIAAGLIAGGMFADTPAAVISEGGTFGQKTVRAPLREIGEAAKASDISAPAVIVVGETAALDFSATYTPPFYGISIAVIASDETAKELVDVFRMLGANAFRSGGVEIEELFSEEIDRAFSVLYSYGCFALTSPNGARLFLKKLREKRKDLRWYGHVKLAAIGSGTAEVLENAGLYPELIPEKFTSAALAELLSKKLFRTRDKILILRSSEGSEELTDMLSEKEMEFDDIRIYKPIYLDGEAVDPDFAVFTSAGIVRGFFGSGGSVSANTKCVAIGEITARELEKFGVSEILLPEESSAWGIKKLFLKLILDI